MKAGWLQLMPYRFLPENFEHDYRRHLESRDAVADVAAHSLSS